ncbi:biotin--[acetyl-CoA-carboxylase] ligase [Nonlabens spongiae]|uniref:Biotin--[acetyl-CoA-carboxylase] ligase n=1 Tax=Nonlabens spongiae TaxID=331648 RepID=A0A1W6MK76_9FLAO|nr:biotin--[acetyl-CoA-carboxylase] ligase [Nonlabens spongiae]ARN78011.1 biotin--[acetyl-CoA-carboxylase] ligase [Nonlabens spongiae]
MKNVVKLHATTSTSDVLRSRFRESVLPNGFTVYTTHQTKGRGQRGAIWQSEPGKNLMFSTLRDNLDDLNAFQINQKTCVILTECIAAVSGLDVKIKWPNDILSAKKKIGGVLVENIFKKGRLSHSIIGIGLNINQKEFDELPHASSISELTGQNFEIDPFLNSFINCFFKDHREPEQIDELYTSQLLGVNRELVFSKNGMQFTAMVIGTDPSGKLVLQVGGKLSSYDLKELEWDYTSF